MPPTTAIATKMTENMNPLISGVMKPDLCAVAADSVDVCAHARAAALASKGRAEPIAGPRISLPSGNNFQERLMNDASIGWIAAIIIGGLAGWIASNFMNSNTGVLANIILGVVGAAVASFLLGFLGVSFGGWLGYLVAGFVGACLLIAGARAVRS